MHVFVLCICVCVRRKFFHNILLYFSLFNVKIKMELVKKKNSSSFVIHWRPYSGKATLLGYRVLVLSLGPRGHRLKRATTQLNGELIHNFTVNTNVTSFGIGNLSAFSKYCVRIGLIVVEGNGGLSKCFYFDTEGSKS